MKKSLALVAAGVLVTPIALATHAWNDYHWARTVDDFPLTVINSTTTDWDANVVGAMSDWSQSKRLDMVEQSGDTSTRTRRQCKSTDGMVQVCNLAYGYTGWLGVAGIYIDSNDHITKGYVKLNDSYYGSGSYYDTYEWRQYVACQELGHTIGLTHTDESFTNPGTDTCMDYQDPLTQNSWTPNGHDYDELDIIYGHLDSYDTYATSGGGGGGGGGGTCNAPPGKGCNKAVPQDDWGRSLGMWGNVEKFVRDNGDGTLVITWVTWAEH